VLERGVKLNAKAGDPAFTEELAEQVRRDKPGSARRLIEKLRVAAADAKRVPKFFGDVIGDLVKKISK
jgi:hypothetical protein